MLSWAGKKREFTPHLFSLSPTTIQGFLKSWGMILVSEIGDKTFFIAAIMAMKHPQRLVSARDASEQGRGIEQVCPALQPLADLLPPGGKRGRGTPRSPPVAKWTAPPARAGP